MNAASTERAWVSMSCGDAKLAWRDYAILGAVVFCPACDEYKAVVALSATQDQQQAAMKVGAV